MVNILMRDNMLWFNDPENWRGLPTGRGCEKLGIIRSTKILERGTVYLGLFGRKNGKEVINPVAELRFYRPKTSRKTTYCGLWLMNGLYISYGIACNTSGNDATQSLLYALERLNIKTEDKLPIDIYRGSDQTERIIYSVLFKLKLERQGLTQIHKVEITN